MPSTVRVVQPSPSRSSWNVSTSTLLYKAPLPLRYGMSTFIERSMAHAHSVSCHMCVTPDQIIARARPTDVRSISYGGGVGTGRYADHYPTTFKLKISHVEEIKRVAGCNCGNNRI